jgi:hypothetical protein
MSLNDRSDLPLTSRGRTVAACGLTAGQRVAAEKNMFCG